MKKNLLRNNKGISMIALIITILVMLILAVVVINLVTDEDGVMSNIGRARRNRTIAKIEEVADLYSNTKLLKDEKLMLINTDIEEAGDTEELMRIMQETYGINEEKVFLGQVNMYNVEEEVRRLLKNEIENEGVEVTGIFNGLSPNNLLGEGEDALVSDPNVIARYNNLEENMDKYKFLYDMTFDFFNETGEGEKYPELTAALSKMMAYIFKLTILDHYVVKIEYDDQVWYLTSNGEQMVKESYSDEFKYDDTNVIGYYGSREEVEIPLTVHGGFEYVTEIGMRNGSYRNESTDEFCYHESYWSLFEDKEMRMTGAEAFGVELNKEYFDMMYALVSEELPVPGEGATEEEKSKYETQQEIKEYFALFGNPTSYEKFMKNTHAKHYDSNKDGKLDDTDDIYMYVEISADGMPKFLSDTSQTVHTVRVPENTHVTKIWNYAFAGDSKLQHVYLPAVLFENYKSDTIGYNAFEGSHPDLIIHIQTPAGWTSEDCRKAENTINGLYDAKNDEEEGYTISWE